MFQKIRLLTYRYKFKDTSELKQKIVNMMLTDVISEDVGFNDINDINLEGISKREIGYYFLDKAKNYHKWASIYKVLALLSIFVSSAIFCLLFLFLVKFVSLTIIFVLSIICFILLDLAVNILYIKSWNSTIMEIECDNLALDFQQDIKIFDIDY